ncbi:hypothetical protein [Ottowia thiooxydans]|uniref:hypothetical protein n=1 Tax=Ottowia thiooxydans TaxID=219182 RepID=UPI0004119491|nr:hypothetical protein [Ottowia thiooxydans]
MASFDQTLADFGQDIGVESLTPGPSGSVQLRFDHGGILGFFQQGADVVLHWAEPAPYDAPELLLRAFKRISDPPYNEPPLQAGLRGVDGVENLVLVTRMPERDCGARELHQMSSWLRQYAAALRG